VGGAEDIVDDRTDGLLVESGDAAALAAALIEVVTNDGKRKAMGAASRRAATERFALETIVGRYLDLFDELGRTA
jgi:glycosyltransferase involved in cell wall biosynthesis